jgi:hypothetical protein
MKRIFISAIAGIFLFTSCKKDSMPEYNSNIKAGLSVEFDNVAGSSDLQLNTGSYTNAAGESFKVTKLKYYVSNFKVTNVNGAEYVIPQEESYFLIDEGDAGSHEPVLEVPEGEYKTLSFVLGVDSLRNTKDVSQRTGVLDVSGAATDMYWSWNSGYIFFKMDGTSPSITSMGGVFQYHVGGFGGYNTPTTNNLRTVTLDLAGRGTPKVKAGKETNIHLFVDVLKALNGTTNMSFAASSMIHSPAAAIPVANNYASMISHDHTEN